MTSTGYSGDIAKEGLLVPTTEAQLLEGICRLLCTVARDVGYATTGTKNYMTHPEVGARSINVYENNELGQWHYNDMFYGTEPFSGTVSVRLNNKLVWVMHYIGSIDLAVEPGEYEAVFTCLKSALRRMPSEFPCRGPEHSNYGVYEYRNTWFGGMERFKGYEVIRDERNPVFNLDYIGGLVCLLPAV